MSQNPHAEQGTSPPLSPPSKFSRNYICRVWKLIARDGGPREVRILKTENSGTVAGIFTDPEQVIAAIASWDTVRSIYLTLNPLKPDMMARENAGRLTRWTQMTAQDKDVTHRVWLMVDVDPTVPVKGISATDGERDIALEVRDRIADWLRTEFNFPDPVSGQTGNGGRLLYGINLPNDAPSTDLVKRVLAALSHHWTGPNATIDTSVFNAGRIDKLWGTMAVKGLSTPDRPHRRSFLDRVPKPIVNVTRDQLEHLAASVAAWSPVPDSPNGIIVRDPAVGGQRDGINLVPYFQEKSLYLAAKEAGMHLVTCPWADTHTADSGRTQTVYYEPSKDNNLAGGFACKHSHCVERKIGDVYRFFGIGGSPRGVAAPSVTGSKPVIVTNQHEDWDELNEKVFSTMVEINTPPIIFERGAKLVRVRPDEKDDPMIEGMTEASCRGYLAHHMLWLRAEMTRTGIEYNPVPPSVAVVRTLLARPEWNGLPPLRDIVQAPVFAPDGTIMVTPGYHPAARVWYHPHGQLDLHVPEKPSEDDLARAREALMVEVLGDFKFDSDASRAHALAAILMPFARTLFPGPTPLHLKTAPTPGSGKGLLVNCESMITTGRPAEITTVPKEDDELRKRITALLRKSTPMVVLDNIAGRLDSPGLAAVLTTTQWSDRILGVSEMTPALPNFALWMATGNNTELSSEIARRTITCRLDPELERPWERTGFRHPELLVWVEQNRSRLVSAALTMIKAWLVADRPMVKHPAIGTFESWADTMAGILNVAGVPGFLENYKAMYELADQEMAPWRAFVAAWWEQYQTKTLSVGDLYDLAQEHLPEVLGDGEQRRQQTKLGLALRKYTGRIIGGCTLQCPRPDVQRKSYRLWPQGA